MSIMDTRHEERDADEEDSLFGSPPPSPGRPASPVLALPSAGYFSGHSSTSTAPTQNVGTIALPGSHPDSELPINPLALSLNHGIVHRPPALPHQMQSQSQSPWQSQSAASGQHGPVSSSSIMLRGTSAAPTAQPHTRNASASTSAQPNATAYGPHGAIPPTNLMRGGTIAAPAVQPPTRNASTSASTQPKKPPKKRTRPSTCDEPPPKPTGPEFALPDPTAPPPTHFLRNQENLLGRAGRIARVKPANLTHARGSTPSNSPHTRGSTPSNPILVEDEDDERPTLGRRPAARERTQPYIDSALLTAPTNQEIVSVLIGQKDIFPILEGVLKLVVGSTPATRPKTGFEHTTTTQTRDRAGTSTSNASHPLKKRKLNRVPAGAADWDVPYPFQQGEGPEEYHETWERERGKQLISQLIQLIKSAARKAATKKYLAEQKQKAKKDAEKQNGGLPKDGSEPATSTIQEGQTSCDVLQDTSNTPSAFRNSIPVPQNPAVSQTPNPQHPQTNEMTMDASMAAAIDQLMFSLDNLPDQGPSQTPGGEDAGMTPTQDFFAPLNTSGIYEAGSTGSATPTLTPIDQPLFDTWMSFLENFPMSFDGTTNAAAHPDMNTSVSQTSAVQSECTTPGTGTGTGTSFGDLDFGDFDAILASMFQQQQEQSDGVTPQVDSGGGAQFVAPPTFEDHLIDPNLLALSLQTQIPSSSSMAAAVSSANSNRTSMDPIPQAISPIASGSSSTFGGSTNPSTPVSAGWELSMPDVFMGGGGGGMEGGMDGQGMWRSTMWDLNPLAYGAMDNVGGWHNVGGGDSGDVMMDFGILPEDVQAVQAIGGSYPANAKGKGKEVDMSAAPAANVSHSTIVSIQTPMPTPTSAPSPSSIPPPLLQLQFTSTPSSQLRKRYEFLTAKSTTEPFLPMPMTFSRQQRRDDIIKLAEEQKRAIQKELDAVKMRLWETTIEQAGLVTLQKRLALKEDGVGGGDAVS